MGKQKQNSEGNAFSKGIGSFGVAPVSIPIYNPMYYGHHVFGDSNGAVIPQQQFVFAPPAGRMHYGFVGKQGESPMYVPQGQCTMNQISQEFINPVMQQDSVEEKKDNESVKSEQKIVRGDSAHVTGATWNPLCARCCGKQNVDENEVAEKEEEKKEEEEPNVSQPTEVKPEQGRVPLPGTWFGCTCFTTPEEFPGFENGSANIFHLNTLFRGATMLGIPAIAQAMEQQIMATGGVSRVNSEAGMVHGAHMVQRMATPQYEIPAGGAPGFWGSCCSHVPGICGGGNVLIQTQSSMGLRGLYGTSTSFTPITTQRSVVSTVQASAEQTDQKAPSVKAPKLPFKPITFKLHAVEIHQFVPMPNMPSTKFIENATPKYWVPNGGAQIYRHGYGTSDSRCFFNPETTGMMAPILGNMMFGVAHIPEMYTMDRGNSKIERMETEQTPLSKSVSPRSQQE